MRIPLGWLGEMVELGSKVTPNDVMAELVKVGLEEEGSHGGDISGPVVVGEVLSFEAEEQKNGKTIRWCQVELQPAATKRSGASSVVQLISWQETRL